MKSKREKAERNSLVEDEELGGGERGGHVHVRVQAAEDVQGGGLCVWRDSYAGGGGIIQMCIRVQRMCLR
jgi:hypothetical protein